MERIQFQIQRCIRLLLGLELCELSELGQECRQTGRQSQSEMRQWKSAQLEEAAAAIEKLNYWNATESIERKTRKRAWERSCKWREPSESANRLVSGTLTAVAATHRLHHPKHQPSHWQLPLILFCSLAPLLPFPLSSLCLGMCDCLRVCGYRALQWKLNLNLIRP